MTGGIIQLVAYGNEDLFLTRDPQITFFKVLYRRHTNFAREEVCQNFISDPDFGKRSSCVISANADLANRMALKITLPAVPKISDTKFAWVKNIGHHIIKSIEIEIGGRVIDRHYGEWLHIFSSLTTRNIKDKSIDRLIGNVPELYNLTNGKDEYVMYVPLYFWFCRSSGLSIPLVALQYSDVRINVEIRELDELYIVSPTHCIKTTSNVTNFKQGEYLIQKIDNTTRIGRFEYFDPIQKKLFYSCLSCDKFVGIPGSSSNSINTKAAILSTPRSDKYIIRGLSSEFYVKPDIGAISNITTSRNLLKNLKLKRCQLMVDYIYLDDDERYKIVNSKHDYLIEQLYFTPNILVDGTNRRAKLVLDQPCKLLVWLAQLDDIQRFNDPFNYTDSIINKLEFDVDKIDVNSIQPDIDSKYTGYRENFNLDPVLDAERVRLYSNLEICDPIGSVLITESTILFNSQERMGKRLSNYYENIQPYQHSDNALDRGINAYSFAINPLDHFPSGTTNTSQIEEIDIDLKMNFKVDINNKAKFRAYGLCYNVWRVNNGLSATIFIR